MEGGPDCFFTRKPGVMEMVDELGLRSELIEPQAKEFMMLVGDRLHRVPAGLVSLNAVRPEALAQASFLSEGGKARALAEPSVPPGGGDDESIRSFFERRFGKEFSRLVAEPLLAGTHSGDPGRLSMRALYPTYLEWERKRGTPSPSETTPQREGIPSATFLSFRGGMRTLGDALADALTRTRVHLRSFLAELPAADRVLLAIPSNRAARLLPGVGLGLIQHGSTCIATYAFRREDVGHPLEGTGFLVPPTESLPVTGATWSSAKWDGRAPEDTVLMRVFMREPGHPREALTPLLGLKAAPFFSRLNRWADAQPQYEVGHLDLVDRIESALPPNVWLAGTSYRGVGIPDCLRQGREAARRIAHTL